MLPELIQYLNTLISPDTENTNKRKNGSTANDCCSRDSNAFCSWAILRRGVVSITYQDKLNTIPHGCHANRNLFPPLHELCGVVVLCWLVGWVGAFEHIWSRKSASLERLSCASAVSHALLSQLWLKLSHHSSGVTKTFKRPQQMDNTVWLKGRFGLQIN